MSKDTDKKLLLAFADYLRDIKTDFIPTSWIDEFLNKKTETKDDIIMETYDVKLVFNRYTETPELNEADIFHLYDTGEECLKDNSGYHDSRHFELLAFNTKTMQKKNCGTHDGISCYSKDLPVEMLRVYADGSFFVKLGRLAKIDLFQNVNLF